MPMSVVGGQNRFPTLQSIADLFRAKINDTFNNLGGTGTGAGGGSGLIMPNSNPDLLTFMAEAVYEIFSDLRNVGDPELVLDNYIVSGLPPVAQQDPTIQVSLAYQGFFDGYQWHSEWVLPINTSKVLAIWERETAANEDFQPVQAAPFGLPGVLQGRRMQFWEMRQGAVWLPGATLTTDLRLRARIGFPMPLSPVNLDFSTTYVPLLDARNAIVSKMMIQYATRFAPEQYQMAVADEDRLMAKIKLEVVRQMQANENERGEFGGEAVQDFAIAWSWL